MAELKFETSDLGPISQGVRVRLAGIIDVTTADTFRATLLTLLSVGFRRILLDFEAVEFVNSAGFASMVELSQHLRDTGGIVVLNQMRPQVEDICVSLGLDAWFGISHSHDEAIKLLQTSKISPIDDLEDGDAVEIYIGPGESSAELVAIGPTSSSDSAGTPSAAVDVPPADPVDADAGASDGFTLQAILNYRPDAEEYADSRLDEDLWADSIATVHADDVEVPPALKVTLPADLADNDNDNDEDVRIVVPAEPIVADDAEPADDFVPAGGETSAADADEESADDEDFQPAGSADSLSLDVDEESVDDLKVVSGDEESADDVETGRLDFTPAGSESTAAVDAAVVEEELDFAPAGHASDTQAMPVAEVDRLAAIEARLKSEVIESQPLSPAPIPSFPTAPGARVGVGAGSANVTRSRSAADRAREEAKAEAERLARQRQASAPIKAKTKGDAPGSPRTESIKAIAALLSAMPESDRLWRKVLVYLTKDAKTQAPTLNLVIAKVPNQRITKDSFPATKDNPYVTIKPCIPGGVCVPEMLAVDVTKGGDEVSFKITKDTNPERPNAVTGKARLEIWYGPALVRMVQAPNPFE